MSFKLISVMMALTVLCASALGQNTAKDWWKMGLDLADQGKFNESIAAAEEAIQLDPTFANP
jgi:hypothetical protein